MWKYTQSLGRELHIDSFQLKYKISKYKDFLREYATVISMAASDDKLRSNVFLVSKHLSQETFKSFFVASSYVVSSFFETFKNVYCIP